MAKKDISDLLAYNLWANQKFNELFMTLSAETADREVSSSFKSLRLTLEHSAGAEFIWLQRMKGISELKFPEFSRAVFPDPEWISCSRALLEFCEGLTEEDLQQEIEYRNLKGVVFRNTLSEIIRHLVNHATFHRGQMVTILRILGITEIPSTDFIAWLRVKN